MRPLPPDRVQARTGSTVAVSTVAVPPHARPKPRPITLLVVSDVRLYRESIAAALAQRETFSVHGSACSPDDALHQLDSSRPDVVIIDGTMKDSLGCIYGLLARAPEIKVVVFAVNEHGPEIISCVEAGVAGYVSSEASIDDLAVTIESVVRGESPCSPRVAAALFQRLAAVARKQCPGEAGAVLSGRERQVLELVRDGLSNKEIARDLNIEVATVKNHIHHLLGKLKVTTRAAAALQCRPASIRSRPAVLRKQDDQI